MASIALGDASAGERGDTSGRMALARWLRTTPGLLRLASTVAAGCLVLTLVVGVVAVTQRGEAVVSVSSTSVAQVATASDLYASLAAADASASSALLRTGTEPEAVRERYLAELERVESLLVTVSQHSDSAPATEDAVRAIGIELAAYVARVEAARINRRQDHPVAAAYMRIASAQMRDEILPAANVVWRDAAERLDDDYAAGTAMVGKGTFATAVVVSFAALVGLSVLLARRTRRFFNIGVLVGALLFAGVGIAALLLMEEQHQALDRARVAGSDPLLMISAASFLALQAQADVNLALAERDTREAYLAEFEELAARVGGSERGTGVLEDARAMLGVAHDEVAVGGSVADVLSSLGGGFAAYVSQARSVLAEDEVGDHDSAVRQALDESPGGLAFAAADLDDRMDAALDRSRERAADAVDDTDWNPDVIAVVLAAAFVAAVVCVVWGTQRRVGEYR